MRAVDYASVRLEAQEEANRTGFDYGGELLAVFCGACQNPICLVCPACKSETADLRKHFKDHLGCWKKADPQGHRDHERARANR